MDDLKESEKLIAIRKKIVSNGYIDDEDVDHLRQGLFENGMTRQKGDFLFEFKDGLSKEKQIPSFKALFIEAISVLLLEDEESPGEIAENEAKWLRAKLQHKGYLDRVDQQLLENLRKKSINFPNILNYKNKYARMFESSLYFSRFLTLFAVAGSLISAMVLFIRGIFLVGNGLAVFFDTFSFKGEGNYEKLLAVFVSSVDIFLVAMVLIIFGMGIYELFINKIDPVERKADDRPSWLQISSIDELKSSLGKVILMVLIVSFFKNSLDVPFDSAKDLLFLSVGVLLIATALYIANKAKKK